jgi:hypothetical protein
MLTQAVSAKILNYCKLQGYPIGWFNIIYIEGMDVDGKLNSDVHNQFNDIRCIFNKEKCTDLWTATCEPGAYYTNRPMNPDGAFRIAFGFHENAWQVGLHGYSNPHEALVQVREIKGYRDYNRDSFRTGDLKVEGVYGINQHWGWDAPVYDIGTTSAGCLVGRSIEGHKQFMAHCYNSGLQEFSTIVLPGDKIFVK